MQTIQFYNTQFKRKETFTPIDPDHVKIYVCGPTVYARPHIGNARPRVVFDVLVRFLKDQYPRVTYASNITDIDDKINQAALSEGQSIQAITERYRAYFDEDMAKLNCRKPDIEPTVTDNIPCIIDTIQAIIDRKHAYVAEGHVLFSVASYPEYGALSGRTIEAQQAGARVAVADFKAHPGDFVLWKPSTGHEPGWDSPWGYGRPGWHIECTANIIAHLGMPIDIHAGGMDLVFPHHENEMAQAHCAADIPVFSRYWLHNGFIKVAEEKMSKSLGNVLFVEDLLKEASGEAIRLALLSTHYRQPIEWRDETLNQARANLHKIHQALKQFEGATAEPDMPFIEALADDLNTPQALARVYQLAKAVMQGDQKAHAKLIFATQSLGLGEQINDATNLVNQEDTARIQALVDERMAAKLAKDYARADALRDELNALNVELHDQGTETTWSWKSG